MSTTTNMGIELIDGSDYISPDPINNGFTKLDALGVDYIVETGTNGEWWYRKWNSGRAECGIDSKRFDTGTSHDWASNWYLYGPLSWGTYPFAFASAPMATVIFRYEDNGATGALIHMHAMDGGSSMLTTAPKFSLADPVQKEYKNPVCGIYVTGRYK